jgi:intracellular sulfur oxidation DsrE/DsrF family protein
MRTFLLILIALFAAPAWSAANVDANAPEALPNLGTQAPNFVSGDRLDAGRHSGQKRLEPDVRNRLVAMSADKPGAAAGDKSDKPQALQFPRIKTAGGVYAMPAGTLMPAADVEHRLVIDAASGDTTPGGTLRRLEIVARAVNLYALAGVPADKLKVAVVLHGKATAAALSDAAYRKHFNTDSPNATLVSALHDAGVEFYVCGQALIHSGYTADEVDADVRVALSAMTTLTTLQAAGYSLIP